MKPSQQAKRPSKTSARGAALALLGEVLGKGRPLDESIATDRSLAELSDRDRAFARHLVATVIRRLGQIDDAIDRALAHPLKPGLTAVRNVLRLGAAQIFFLETAPHAAVAATVDLANGRRLAGFRGLINAVLRRFVREGQAWVEGRDAARLNTPDWLWDSWCGAYGEAAAGAIAARHLEDPPLDLSFKPGEGLGAWAEQLGATKLPGGGLRLASGHGRIDLLPGYETGSWWVQDAAAGMPARLLGDVSGRHVVDLCAAPGGKTVALAASGAEVVAVDRSESRMSRLSANLDRLGLGAEVVVADAATWRPDRSAELVLLDAPCSGTGTLRRHPDIARLKSPSDVTSLTKDQDRLLRAAVSMCAPGGLIVYAVCSLQPEEGPERIAALLGSGAEVERLPITPEDLSNGPEDTAALRPLVTPEGDLRSLPSHFAELGGVDGFFACRLRKR